MADDLDIGIGVRADPGAQAVVDALRARLAALREELARTAIAQEQFNGGSSRGGAATAAAQSATAANEAIGAFVKLGQTVDATNRTAVAAFRAEGDAISVYLAKLNATDAELNKIGASIARVEQRAGAARFAVPAVGVPTQRTPAVIIPRIPEETISSFDRAAPRIHTAANAIALLSIAAETGRGSLQGMATAAGNVAIGVGALLTGPVGGLVVALGAIVTLVTVAVGLWKEAHKQLDATGKAEEEAAAARIERLAGEDAAQAEGIRKQAATQIRAVNEAKGTEKQKADSIVAINEARDEKLATLEKTRREKSTKDIQAGLNELAAASDKLFLNQEQQLQASLDREFAARKKALDDAEKLATNDPDEKRRQQRLDAIARQRDTNTREQNVRTLQIVKDAGEQRVSAERAANARLLELTGQETAAQTLRIKEQFDELVKSLIAKGVPNARAIAQSILNAEAAQNAIDAIERKVTQTFAKSDNAIARTSALLAAHQISAGDARARIVAALAAERDAVAASIPLLQQQADALGGTGNPAILAKLDAAKTKLLELSLAVNRAGDRFAELKDTAREAATAAVAGFLEGASKLGSQSHVEVNALTTELRSAQKELSDLLAIPAQQRTGENNKRISELRAEIESTSVSLENAKGSITSWRDLFVSALQSIADALVKVSSQMLATAFIEKLLGLAVPGDPTDAILAGGITGVSAIGFARGAVFRGPGTSTSDSILARVSNGEGILNARAVQIVGEPFVNFLNALGNGGRIPRFNAGGLVESSAAQAFSDPQRIDLVVHSTEDSIVRVMKGSKGRDITVTHVRGNARSLGISD